MLPHELEKSGFCRTISVSCPVVQANCQRARAGTKGWSGGSHDLGLEQFLATGDTTSRSKSSMKLSSGLFIIQSLPRILAGWILNFMG